MKIALEAIFFSSDLARDWANKKRDGIMGIKLVTYSLGVHWINKSIPQFPDIHIEINEAHTASPQ